jgi:hypothetical protein
MHIVFPRTPARALRRRHFVLLAKPPLFGLVAALLTGACSTSGSGPFEVYGQPSGAFSVAVGQQIDIKIGTAGPGEYVSPPTLNGSAIAFLSVTPGAALPSGVQQIFHFKGVARGQTVVVFQNTNPPGIPHPDVIDTVVVR